MGGRVSEPSKVEMQDGKQTRENEMGDREVDLGYPRQEGTASIVYILSQDWWL